jgi:hypothetical protein
MNGNGKIFVQDLAFPGGLTIDYAYAPYGALGDAHRMSVNLSF